MTCEEESFRVMTMVRGQPVQSEWRRSRSRPRSDPEHGS